MAKDTCTSCGGSGVVKKKIQQETPNPSMGGRPKEKNPEKNPTKPKDYTFKSNAQRKKPSKGEKNNGN